MNDLREKLPSSEGSVKFDDGRPVFSGGFVNTPDELTFSDLPSHAVRLWLILKRHCIKDPFCFPSAKWLAQLMGVSKTALLKTIPILEGANYLTVTRNRGGGNVYYPTIPENAVNRSTRVDQSTTVDQLRGTGQPELTGVVNQGLPDRSTKVDREVDEINRRKEVDLANASKQQSKSNTKAGKKHTPSQTRASVEAAIDALDLQKFGAKYPSLNIPDEHDRFREHFLDKNDAKTGKPNWMKWSDWSRAFHRWCQNSMNWNQERRHQSQPPRTSDTGPQYQDLSNYTLE